jgi:hypothetical protein
MPNFTDIQNALIDALNQAKIYIDAKDADVKAYAETKIAELAQTTDLSAKLELLQQINTILDGDAATAGFQAWQSQVTKLTGLVSDFEAFKATQTESIDATNKNVEALGSVVEGLRVALADATASTALVDTFTSVKTQAASIFAV